MTYASRFEQLLEYGTFNRFRVEFLVNRLEERCVRGPEVCRCNPLIHDFIPKGFWAKTSYFDEDSDGHSYYMSWVQDNIYEFGATHVFRRFGKEDEERGRGMPNGTDIACERIPFDEDLPEKVTCVVTRTYEDRDVENIVYARCDTWVHCGSYGNASGDCCTYMFEEPGEQCREGAGLDTATMADVLDEQCSDMEAYRAGLGGMAREYW